MRITILVENDVTEGHPALKAEHGLSFYIDINGHVVMSDVGQSGKFAENAKILGCDLQAVEALAISHHHYDHGGGLGCFFEENDRAKVYLRQAPKADYIVDVLGLPLKYIGLDQTLLKTHASRIIFVTKNTNILPGVHLLTNIPETYPRPGGDKRLKAKRNGEKLPDSFEHELVTVLDSQNGLVILTGCAHTGVLNMIKTAQDAFPKKPIRAVIGGFHLNREKDDAIRYIGETLLSMDIPEVYTGHCTGSKAVDILSAQLGERFHPLGTGTVLEC
jgi:7,8-dihydropterin-6-yl-methyl-4-(beta-D-ribofuranosyl)aminobenzene 5'-phosphate synthase